MLKLQSSLKAACMAVAALAVSGCSQDELVNQPTQKGNTTIVASFEGASTRTSVNESNQVVWNANDAFGLFYTSESQTTPKAARFSCPDADGTKTSATFTGVLDNDITTSYAVYPYDQDGMSLNGTTVTMTLPSTLNYGEANKQMASNGPMYAPASNISQSLEFKHLAGLLKLTVSKGIDVNAKKFVITADNSIAGTCTADLSTDKPTLAVTADGSTTITVTLPSFTDDGQGNVTTFYIPIPVGTYTTLSAQLTDDGGNDLYTAKEWTNVTVTRAGMLTASFGYVKIDAGTGDLNKSIADALPTQTPPAAPMTTNLQINGTIDATSGTSAIEIPIMQNSNVNMELTTIPTTSADNPLEVKDNSTTVTTPTDAVNTVTIAIPKVEQGTTAPHLTITMPQTTVELDATDEAGTTYEKVIATTASNTLVIKKGVTVNELVVKGGNVRVAGTVTNISKDEGLTTTPYLIMEKGATVSSGSDAFTVIDAAAYDLMMAFANGKDYVLTEDISIIGKSLVVPGGKTSTLDLNGHTITASNKKDVVDGIRVKGNFTLKDSKGGGKIVADHDWVKNEYGTTLIYIDGEDAHMTMESGTVYAVRSDDPANKGQYGVGVYDGGDFTMTGGKIEAGWFAVAGNGNDKTQNSIIKIEGGELISTADYAIYLPHKGSTTISGGKINGATGGVAIQRGTLVISDNAQILSTDEGNTGNWTDGTGNLGNAALVVAAKYDDCTVNITGGTFSSLKNAALIDASTVTTHAKVINVSGGTFSDTGVLDYLTDNANVKVLLNADKSVKGFITKDGQTVEIDLNNHILTLGNPTVGSPGTETNSCQLLEGSKVTFKNGKVQSDNTEIMIQNYCDLLLQDATVEATKANYVISNNNGSCTINNSTITAGSGKCAFDVYSFSTYAGVTVTVNQGSIINGNLEFGGDNKKQNGKLIINDGNINGNLKVTDEYYNEADPNIVISGGTFSDPSVLAYLKEGANVKVKLGKDHEGPGFGLYNVESKNGSKATVEVDLNSHTWTLTDEPLFGSTGTVNQYFHLEQGATVTLKNGIIQTKENAASHRMVIQNYCNLTLDGLTVTGKNVDYVVSNNCGNTMINNTTLTAGDGKFALDVCGFSTYPGVSVTVKGNTTINGKVEISKSAGNTGTMALNIEGGTFVGDLVIDSSISNASEIIKITGNPTFTGENWSTYQSNN